MAKWRLAALCGEEFLNLGKFNRQALLGNRIRHTILVVDWEWLTPVALTAEDSVAQTVVDLHTAKPVLGHKLLCLCNGLFYSQTVEV